MVLDKYEIVLVEYEIVLVEYEIVLENKQKGKIHRSKQVLSPSSRELHMHQAVSTSTLPNNIFIYIITFMCLLAQA